MFGRIRQLIVKELLAVLRDPQTSLLQIPTPYGGA
jgi:hypothetical protein